MNPCSFNNFEDKYEKKLSTYAELLISNTFLQQELSIVLGKEHIISLSMCLYFPTINFTGSNKGENLKKASN